MVVIQVQLQTHPSKFNGFSQHPSVYNIQRSKKLSLQAKAISSRTQRIMESISVGGEVGGAGGAYSYDALKRLDNLWSSICSDQRVVQEPKQVVSNTPGLFSESDIAEKEVDKFDVLVCGGTLGIFVATALSLKGLRVGIVERNQLKGREQEWNISRKELLELVEVGILTEDEIELTTTSVFNPVKKIQLNLQQTMNNAWPAKLIDIMRERFNSLGGTIFEGCSVSSIDVYQDIAVLQLTEGKILSACLIIDAMGNFSPVLKQIRGGKKPDGICLVVGSCCCGFKENSSSDVIFSSAEAKPVGNSEAQYFWEVIMSLDRTFQFGLVLFENVIVADAFEISKLIVLLNQQAFPAGSGPLDRTTYMFTYVEPQPSSPKLEELLEDYWDLMPKYQEVTLDELEILRVIYGIFPTYRDRSSIEFPLHYYSLQFGDASGIQSPVSFGIHEAISANLLDSDNLSLLNPYMPNLSASWLFQRAMSARKQAGVSPDFINELLYANFQSMQVPLLPMIDTFPTETKYKWKRQLEAWKYGSGLDYKFESEDTTKEYVGQKPLESKIGSQNTI
ncbi:hypothetical protein Ccrd_004874 [Cynara cardunculus var. scolymus]|uniref:Uncharacterized protein n=1 Tax=Cynara cardunculus var. scolymus TaxID=59895 RepID=A0A103XLV3_CYNCS|nr:hypothetical protein Ccrd_004874 [Cynara cardunculus var. scolymus]